MFDLSFDRVCLFVLCVLFDKEKMFDGAVNIPVTLSSLFGDNKEGTVVCLHFLALHNSDNCSIC